MVHKFPGINLIAQLVRQITQPVSRYIVNHVKDRPLLKKYVLIQLGCFQYWCEDVLAHQKIPAVVKKKRDEIRIMERGAKLLIEILVFGLLWSILICETRTSIKKSRITEQLRIQDLNYLEAEKNQLMRRVEDQVILTKRLKDIIVEYSRQVGCTLPRDPEKGE
ncbi:putative OPA3-like protein CG13603 [Cataglyphis hispanica]|uniref:putative OPA3-like protein CG13603 n=1 Tax=Cataglyphis hispanica TaxID=1086592 RepID=UPI00217F2E9A|nr:putative OPA3-like protein CG13603 [Cataglyphis hispanica]